LLKALKVNYFQALIISVTLHLEYDFYIVNLEREKKKKMGPIKRA
jgi:hypothetical protein